MNNKPAIIFVHGLVRPPFMNAQQFEYFRGVRSALADLPVTLHFPTLPSGASIEERAAPLAAVMDTIESKVCYLIGHSMGGLDCRYYINNHRNDSRIKRLITVATPHHGTPLADWAIKSHSPLAMILRSQFVDGIQDLTSSACKRFNHNVPNRDDVEYLSYAASRPHWELPAWLRSLTKHTSNEPNDGLVPITSAHWGHFESLLHADHFEISGWNLAFSNFAEQRPFDHIGFYRRLVNEAISDTENKTAGV